MGTLTVASDVKQATISAVVIRADGRREDLGIIAYHHRNPIRRLIWRLKEMLRV